MTYRFRSVFGLGIAALCLSSCSNTTTQWMPNGYRYNDDTPLSSPAPTRPWNKDLAHADLNKLGDTTAAWQGAIYELISPLPPVIAPSASSLTLKQDGSTSPVDAAFDHYLRQGLLSYGYVINPTVSNPGTIITYNAAPLSDSDTQEIVTKKYGKDYIKKGEIKDMYYLTLKVLSPDGKTTISQQSTVAVLP